MTSLTSPSLSSAKAAARLFLWAYVASCVLFWWLPDILFWIVMGETPEGNWWAIRVSALALVVFVFSYLLPQSPIRRSIFSESTLNTCERFLYKATLIWSFPAFVFGLHFGLYRWTVQYGEGNSIPFLQQVVLYVHMFLAFAFLGVVKDIKENRRRIGIVVFLTVLPRLIVSLHWGRFFLAQALVPILLIALARGWVKLSSMRVLQLSIIALFLFLVPPLMRGNQVFGTDSSGQYAILDFLKSGSPLVFLQENRDLATPCPPLLISLTQKVFPYGALHICTVDVGDAKNIPASLENLLTHEYSDDLLLGSGSIYLLELYLTGGVFAIVIGTVAFAISCRRFIEWIGQRSLFAGIWAECLSRALLAPRGNLGYVYERIPSLLVATLLVVFFCQLINALRQAPAQSPSPGA